MKKIILYSAMSFNGKIAKKDGTVAWLDAIPHPEGEDYGYADFYEGIDTTIMGYATYHQVINFDIPFPYPDKTNYVLTRKKDLKNTQFVHFVHENPIEFIQNIKQQQGKNIWLIGGGQVNTLLLNGGLIDKMIVHMMPVILDDGIDLFPALNNDNPLKLINSKTYSSGVIELVYELN